MILFLDTVSPLPAFSIIRNNKVIESIQILKENSNKISDCIIPTFIKLQKNLQINDKIEKLIVCTGPGSYTALRVGIAFMYGLSFSKKIPLIGIACSNLLHLSLSKSKELKTLMFICSSNDQNFISICSSQNEKYFIKKLDKNFQCSHIDYNQYSSSISNYTLPSSIKHTLKLKNHYEINLAEAIRLNLKDIISLPTDNIIEPIYVSDNKILN